jgi:hypothetical protein
MTQSTPRLVRIKPIFSRVSRVAATARLPQHVG